MRKPEGYNRYEKERNSSAEDLWRHIEDALRTRKVFFIDPSSEHTDFYKLNIELQKAITLALSEGNSFDDFAWDLCARIEQNNLKLYNDQRNLAEFIQYVITEPDEFQDLSLPGNNGKLNRLEDLKYRFSAKERENTRAKNRAKELEAARSQEIAEARSRIRLVSSTPEPSTPSEELRYGT